jgi:uncharacterized protein YlzI (FlbEa/FlbD family)
MVFTLCFLMLSSLQLLSGQPFEADIEATVDAVPDTLNLMMHGKWITVYVELPEGYSIRDIDIETVGLCVEEWNEAEKLNASWWNIQDTKLMLKFDAEQVINRIWLKIYHIGEYMPQDNVTVNLIVVGELHGGLTFKGVDEIRVIAPSL